LLPNGPYTLFPDTRGPLMLQPGGVTKGRQRLRNDNTLFDELTNVFRVDGTLTLCG